MERSTYVSKDGIFRAYPKGVDVDDRGYVYTTISYNKETGASLTVLKDSDGTAVSETFVDFGQTDSAANGIAVRKDGDKFGTQIT